MKKLLILSSLLMLSACITTETLKTAQEVENSITCTKDDFSGITNCKMPIKSTCGTDGTDAYMSCNGLVSHSGLALNYDENKKAKLAVSGYIIALKYSYPKSAIDADGQSMKFSNIDSRIELCTSATACQHREYFDIEIDKDYLIKHKESGISIKIYGTRANARVDLPAQYVQGMLNYIKNNDIK